MVDDRSPAGQAASQAYRQDWNKNALDQNWNQYSDEEELLARKISGPRHK
jgi:hypothetical protein